MTPDRHDDAICGCCARSAVGYGYAPRQDKPVVWVCDDPECLKLARDTYAMKQDKFTRIEALAAARAAEAMGQRLDEMGLGHLFETMSWEQWLEAMRTGIASYRSSLSGELRNEAPF